jgi:hypothetical protein
VSPTRPENAVLTDVAKVRDVLGRELETISHYERLADAANLPEIQSFLRHLASEEKEHVAEAMQLLRLLDPELEPHFQKEFDKAHFQPPATPPSKPAAASPSQPVREDLKVPANPGRTLYALPAPPPAAGAALTVGPLKRRKL